MKKHPHLKKAFLFLALLSVLVFFLVACKSTDDKPAEEPQNSSFSSNNTTSQTNSNNTASQANSNSQSEGKYCASKDSDVYHYYTCGYVDKIKAKNLIRNDDYHYFTYRGYRACKRCLN